MSTPKDKDLIDLMIARDGRWTRVRLRTGEEFRVLNIAWGYDEGEEWAHVTTNVSPAPNEETEINVFSTSDVVSATDEATGAVVFESRR